MGIYPRDDKQRAGLVFLLCIWPGCFFKGRRAGTIFSSGADHHRKSDSSRTTTIAQTLGPSPVADSYSNSLSSPPLDPSGLLCIDRAHPPGRRQSHHNRTSLDLLIDRCHRRSRLHLRRHQSSPLWPPTSTTLSTVERKGRGRKVAERRYYFYKY
ncbi:unnamed protein product [Linum trigynum]|uniref:Uncharacterized protein n=1 Tax=Linum trigynum TaxID=586398 RepID=A0AAV2EVQ6_9ROSI